MIFLKVLLSIAKTIKSDSDTVSIIKSIKICSKVKGI